MSAKLYKRDDEIGLAAEVMQKYGYLVFAWDSTLAPGALIPSIEVAGAQRLKQPFAVIAPTTRQEYDEHNRFIDELCGETLDDDEDVYPYYYRVTTD